MTTIILDSNEHATHPHFKQQLEQALGAPVQVDQLGVSSGDLFVQLPSGDAIIFERKETPSDLCASIQDGRLFEQASQIPNVARFPFLVLHGVINYSAGGFVMDMRGGKYIETGWRKSSIEMALVRVQASGMIVVQTQTYVQQVAALVDWCQTADAAHYRRKKILKTGWETPEELKRKKTIEYIASIDGVGPQRAQNLVDAYPDASLHRLLLYAAYPESKIPLWSTKTYQTVREFLGVETNEHQENTSATSN